MVKETRTQPPGPGHAQWLVFECGCMIPSILIHPKSGYPRRCPSCKSKMVDKILICPDCKKAYFIGKNGRRKDRCAKCAQIYRSGYRYSRDSKSDLRFAKSRDRRTCKAKVDCVNYGDCLTQAAINDLNSVYCDGCADYDPQPMHAAVYAVGGSLEDCNQGCTTNYII